MKNEVTEFRRTAEQRRKQGRSARYTTAERAFAVWHARARMTAGSSLQSAARELGVSGQTLTYWLRPEGVPKAWRGGPRARLVPVVSGPELVAVMESVPAIVVVVGAVRVEVTDVALAAELVRRLR